MNEKTPSKRTGSTGYLRSRTSASRALANRERLYGKALKQIIANKAKTKVS